jgi:hypothetical protein
MQAGDFSNSSHLLAQDNVHRFHPLDGLPDRRRKSAFVANPASLAKSQYISYIRFVTLR